MITVNRKFLILILFIFLNANFSAGEDGKYMVNPPDKKQREEWKKIRNWAEMQNPDLNGSSNNVKKYEKNNSLCSGSRCVTITMKNGKTRKGILLDKDKIYTKIGISNGYYKIKNDEILNVSQGSEENHNDELENSNDNIQYIDHPHNHRYKAFRHDRLQFYGFDRILASGDLPLLFDSQPKLAPVLTVESRVIRWDPSDSASKKIIMNYIYRQASLLRKAWREIDDAVDYSSGENTIINYSITDINNIDPNELAVKLSSAKYILNNHLRYNDISRAWNIFDMYHNKERNNKLVKEFGSIENYLNWNKNADRLRR